MEFIEDETSEAEEEQQQDTPSEKWDKSPSAIAEYHEAAQHIPIEKIKNETDFSFEIPDPWEQVTPEHPSYIEIKNKYIDWNQRCQLTKKNKPFSRAGHQRARSWILTWYNYNAAIINQTLCAMIKCGTMESCALGFEICPTTNREHIHAFVQFFDKIRMAALKNMFPHAQYASEHENPQTMQAYVLKHKDPRNWYTTLRNKKTYQKRAEITESLYKKRLTLADVREQNPDQYYYNKSVWEMVVSDLYDTEVNKREVIWIWGETGLGKTKMVNTEILQQYKNIHAGFDIAHEVWDCGLQTGQFFNGISAAHKLVILDDFRDDMFKFNHLLKLLGPTNFKVDVKGGHSLWKPSCVIITCDRAPHECYINMQQKFYNGNQNPIEQLLRRISHAIHITPNGKTEWKVEPQPGQRLPQSYWNHWHTNIKENPSAQVSTFTLPQQDQECTSSNPENCTCEQCRMKKRQKTN